MVASDEATLLVKVVVYCECFTKDCLSSISTVLLSGCCLKALCILRTSISKRIVYFRIIFRLGFIYPNLAPRRQSFSFVSERFKEGFIHFLDRLVQALSILDLIRFNTILILIKALIKERYQMRSIFQKALFLVFNEKC